MRTIFYQDRLLPQPEVKIPFEDRGFLFGEGVFRTLAVQDGKVEFFQAHLDRFERDCRSLLGKSVEVKREWVDELVLRNAATSGRFRLKWILTPDHFLMMLHPFEVIKRAFNLGLYPDPVVCPLAKIKTLAYVDRFIIKKAGPDDALVHLPFVMETSNANIFWKDKGRFYTPDKKLPYLNGVTIEQFEKALGPFEQVVVESIPEGSHVYLCNAMSYPIEVASIGEQNYPIDAELTKNLKQQVSGVAL